MGGRVTASRKRWRKTASLLVNRSIGLRTKGRVYEACLRSALLNGAEIWALTSRLMDVLRRCYPRMPRYLAGVRLQDGRSSSDTNPSQVSSQQTLVLIYLPRKDGKLSYLRRERRSHKYSNLSRARDRTGDLVVVRKRS